MADIQDTRTCYYIQFKLILPGEPSYYVAGGKEEELSGVVHKQLLEGPPDLEFSTDCFGQFRTIKVVKTDGGFVRPHEYIQGIFTKIVFSSDSSYGNYFETDSSDHIIRSIFSRDIVEIRSENLIKKGDLIEVSCGGPLCFSIEALRCVGLNDAAEIEKESKRKGSRLVKAKKEKKNTPKGGPENEDWRSVLRAKSDTNILRFWRSGDNLSKRNSIADDPACISAVAVNKGPVGQNANASGGNIVPRIQDLQSASSCIQGYQGRGGPQENALGEKEMKVDGSSPRPRFFSGLVSPRSRRANTVESPRDSRPPKEKERGMGERKANQTMGTLPRDKN